MINNNEVYYSLQALRLKELYRSFFLKSVQKIELYKIQLIRPETILKNISEIREIISSSHELVSEEKEMVSFIVSRLNKCDIVSHFHNRNLLEYWKEEKKVSAFMLNYINSTITMKQRLLCDYAVEITKYDKAPESGHIAKELLAMGLSENGLVDATLLIAYRNFSNKIINALTTKMTRITRSPKFKENVNFEI